MNWRDRAACRDVDPELFYPERHVSVRPAKRICQGCPVQALCLEYAMGNGERWGIWGGKSEWERRRLGKAT